MDPRSNEDERAGIARAIAEGRFETAIERLSARVLQAPSDPARLAELAVGLLAARRPEAALEAYRAALKLAPGHPALLCATAMALQGLARSDEAATLYRAVLARDPANFKASFGLALLGCETGDWDQVETIAGQLAARHGARPDLEWLIARADLGRGRLEPALERLERLLASAALGPAQASDLLLMQSEALDRLGRPPPAFASAVQGKTIQRQLYSERAAGREGQVERLRRLARWFERTDPAPWRAIPADTPAPGGPAVHVFVLGFPRSGTTLLEQALAGRPDVVALEEAPTLAEPYAEFMTSDEGLRRLADMKQDQAAFWRGRYWDQVRGHGVDPAGKTFVDKAPAETLNLPVIARLFPRAKVLFALRDPRDVVLSCLRHNFQMNALTWTFTDLGETAACYDACMALAEIYRRVLPIDVTEVRLEALVDDFPAEMDRIGAFLRLEPSASAPDPAEVARGRRVRTPSADQVRAGLNRSGLGRWRAYAAELEPVLPVLQPWVRRFGYVAA